MEPDIAESPNRVPWPPIVLFGALGLGFALGAVVPLPWLEGRARDIAFGAGLLMVTAALVIDMRVTRIFRRHGTTLLPHRGADALATDGPFAWSRNPIYLGNLVLIAGVGLAAGELWHLVLVPVAALLLERLAIVREEAHLEAKFGQAWRDYARRVRRWI
ncbi:methyltransferase family protein [Propylenella binzhouense]|uniref:Isoprenylcysteine carboxylmethyltransferase family protein n=1 Tax=Propylenella binzhouense TaxID=2555902 RepID=A0A964T7I2_9HYPH|nr:isoprenylcysteine carboxylmethyltransferase family protein [Propylenella binzhouense]MYZ49510.1 isoprenylcysteine carboxylmethyltransferase family protein [Propylenella binzhouense]